MYKKFYNLRDKPFSLTPDTKYLYLGSYHKEALDRMSSSINKKYNLFVLTGVTGSGKTIVLKSVIERLKNFRVIQVFYPAKECEQLLQMILINLGIDPVRGDLNALRIHLKEHLLKLHRIKNKPLLVIDEAHNFSKDALEEILRILDFRYRGSRVVKVLLAGLPQLQESLSPLHKVKLQGDMATYHINNIPDDEVNQYIQHRLTIAGSAHTSIFSAEVTDEINHMSGGNPRLINMICDLLLVQGYISKKKIITTALLEEVSTTVSLDMIPDKNTSMR